MKKLYSFAVKARNDLAAWLSSLSEPLIVDMMDLERKHLPHVMQLQYVQTTPSPEVQTDTDTAKVCNSMQSGSLSTNHLRSNASDETV